MSTKANRKSEKVSPFVKMEDIKVYPYTLTSRNDVRIRIRARGYKSFFMLNSVEHEVFLAHIC